MPAANCGSTCGTPNKAAAGTGQRLVPVGHPPEMATIWFTFDGTSGGWCADCRDCGWAYTCSDPEECRKVCEWHQRLHTLAEAGTITWAALAGVLHAAITAGLRCSAPSTASVGQYEATAEPVTFPPTWNEEEGVY